MDSEASTSGLPLDSQIKNDMKENAKKDNKECQGQKMDIVQDEEKEKSLIIKKKVSTSSAKSATKNGNEIPVENKTDEIKRKNSDEKSADLQIPSTSELPKKLSKEKLPRSKKLSVEEAQRPIDPTKSSSKRRRSSIPDFSQEESVGTNPALFIWHKPAFKASEDHEDEYLTSDPIESEMEDESHTPPQSMVVSESTIMFIHPEESETASPDDIHKSEADHQDGGNGLFHLSEADEDLVDDAFGEDDSGQIEPIFDVIIEEIDIKTGTTIDTPRASDSGSDLLMPSEINLSPKQSTFENNFLEEQPLSKLSNASSSNKPLEVILEETKNENQNVNDDLPTIPDTVEKFETVVDKGCIESVKEESFEKPPRPPPTRTKKLSINYETQQPSTSSAEANSSDDKLKNESENINLLSTSEPPIIPDTLAIDEATTMPILTAPPIPPPPKSVSSKSLKQEIPLSEKLPPIINESCLPRIFQTLTIWPQQFRPLPGLLLSDASRVSIQIKLDDEDILQTVAVGGNPSRVFSEKATIEIKRSYQYIKLIFIEHTENSETRQIGKMQLRKKDILPINGKDVILPVQGSPLTRSTVFTVLGEICLSMEPKNGNIVKLGVLDYTASIPIPPRRLSTSSTSSTSSLSSPPPFFQTRVHLLTYITAYGELIGAMSKITLFDRRSIESVEFNTKGYSEKCSAVGTSKHASSDSMNGSAKSNSNGKDSSHVRLNIKIYSEPTYDENSYVGFVRIPLDPETFMPLEKNVGANWYEIKSRMTISQNTTILQQASTSSATSSTNNLTTSQYDNTFDTNLPSTSTSTLTSTTTMTTTNLHQHNNNMNEKVGDLRIRFWYSVEHILALNHYQPLFDLLMGSLDTSKPYDISFTSILQYLPIDLGHIARPLMKIFLKNDLMNDFFRLVCTQYVASTNEVSTLFRNQSMASKTMHEMMKFCGSEYLISTLKPIIDLVYAEKKRCEIDPTKLLQGENLEENTRNFAVYAELAFVRVCESTSQCPQLLKSIFNVLREVVSEKYPDDPNTSRLSVSSFIIMRFFAAAILNPTQYGLKRKAPEPDVSRTLVLISKILQRIANCVVTKHPLINKEPWLSLVLERFFDDGHQQEMVEFFDSISIRNYQSPKSSISSQNRKPEVLKSGLMVEKRGGSGRRRSIKDVFSQKRRLVTLTQKELSWQKEKKDSQNDVEQKGVISLSEITSVTQCDTKSSFRVATPNQEIHFQALNNFDMTEWMILLITHQRRHLFFNNRACGKAKNLHHIDIEKELETLHSLLFENIETIIKWKELVEAFNLESDIKPGDKFPNIVFLKNKEIDERRKLKEMLLKTLTTLLAAVQQIETVHQTALTLAIQMQNLQSMKPDKLGISGLSDNENYLLMRGREHRLKSKGLQAV